MSRLPEPDGADLIHANRGGPGGGTTTDTATPQLRELLQDSVLHALFSPVYVLHRPPGRAEALWPLFAYEASLHTLLPDDDDVRTALGILDRFGRDLTGELLHAQLGGVTPRRWSGREVLHVDVGSRRLPLGTALEVAAFSRIGPVAMGLPIHTVRSTRTASVLVLGSYVPYPPRYIDDLWRDPRTPLERFRAGEQLRPIELTLLLCELFESDGLYALTPKADRRHIVNVYERTQSLMSDADVIVLILESGALGAAMELGMICAQPDLARKTVVLARASDPLTGLATFGAFRLNRLAAVSYFSGQEELVSCARSLVWDAVGAP